MWLRAVGLGAFALVVLVGAWWTWMDSRPPRFCVAALAGTDIDGLGVILEDQGEPGDDGCDRDQVPDPSDGDPLNGTRTPPLVLGYDCKVRDVDGDVIATSTPNRTDGTCGLSQ